MDLRAALSALRARWWVLALTTALTVAAGVALTFLQPRAFVATSTYVVAPTPSFRGEVLNAMTLISRQSEIAETFAQIAMSSYVANAVRDELACPRAPRRRPSRARSVPAPPCSRSRRAGLLRMSSA